MNGFERLQEQIKDTNDTALKQVVEQLVKMPHMEQRYLNDEKNIADMCKFIKSMAQKHANNGWNCVTNEIVYAWAVMYYSLPNKLLKIDEPKKNNAKSNKTKTENTNKNNVISMEDAKKELEEKKQTQQISLFGGVA